MGTVRENIVKTLQGQALTTREISGAIGISEKEVASHLSHIHRSLSSRGQKLVVRPSRCLECDYIFKQHQRFKKPGRCPLCKSERLAPPRFSCE
ncbi:MAG: transcriptional regulator [Desulfosudaceae bacterium]